jgi:hypothetical protein
MGYLLNVHRRNPLLQTRWARPVLPQHQANKTGLAQQVRRLPCTGICSRNGVENHRMTPQELVAAGFTWSRMVMMNEAHDGWKRCRRTMWACKSLKPRWPPARVILSMEALNPDIAQHTGVRLAHWLLPKLAGTW